MERERLEKDGRAMGRAEKGRKGAEEDGMERGKTGEGVKAMGTDGKEEKGLGRIGLRGRVD